MVAFSRWIFWVLNGLEGLDSVGSVSGRVFCPQSFGTPPKWPLLV